MLIKLTPDRWRNIFILEAEMYLTNFKDIKKYSNFPNCFKTGGHFKSGPERLLK